MASSFYVNNFTTSIINTKNKIIMSVHCVYFTNSPIYLTLLPSPFANRATPFLFVNICLFCFCFLFFFLFFFEKASSSLLQCFYWLFCFQFWFVLFRFNLIFVRIDYLFLVLQQFFSFFAR